MPAIAFLFWLGLGALARAQSPVPPRPGDLAFLQISSQTPDYVAFIVLVDHCDLRGLKYTDNGWSGGGGFRTTEGTGALPSDSAWSDVPLNTVVEITTSSLPVDSDYGDGYMSARFPASKTPSLSQSGDQFFMYSVDETTSRVICGIHTYGSDWDGACTSSASSVRPSGDGNFVAVGKANPSKSVVNAYFSPSGGPIAADAFQVKWLINDRANWKSATTRPDNRAFALIRVINTLATPTPTMAPTPTLTPTPEGLSSQNWHFYE